MILQSLHEYYRSQVAAGNPLYAPAGMELKRVHFVLVLNADGMLTGIERPELKVCVAGGRPRGGKDAPLTANRMWDSLGYVTGQGATPDRLSTARVQHRSFRQEVSRIHQAYPHNRSFAAVARFYSIYFDQLLGHPLWQEIASRGGHNLSFRLRDESALAAQQPELLVPEPGKTQSTCLVTGDKAAIARLHPKFYVPAGAPTGSKLVSFTKGSGYDSYGKKAGENAPVCEVVAQGYAAALTGMLQPDSGSRVSVGDVSFLFYTLPHSDFSNIFRTLMDPSVKDGRGQAYKALGQAATKEPAQEFHLLAIVPNAARLSVRLFIRMSVSEAARHLSDFYRQIEMTHSYHHPGPIALLTPLLVASPNGDIGKLPPQLMVEYVQAVVCGTALPVQLQWELLARLREQKQQNPAIVWLLRCWVNRAVVPSPKSPTNDSITVNHIPMALDKTINNTGYLLGRTFAILERAQELSAPGIKFTFRDSYYTIASVTPSAVFNRLICLSTVNLRRICSPGTAIFMKMQLREVTELLDGSGIPARLSLEDQSRFALGYFHQRQTYFTKKETTDEPTD